MRIGSVLKKYFGQPFLSQYPRVPIDPIEIKNYTLGELKLRILSWWILKRIAPIGLVRVSVIIRSLGRYCIVILLFFTHSSIILYRNAIYFALPALPLGRVSLMVDILSWNRVVSVEEEKLSPVNRFCAHKIFWQAKWIATNSTSEMSCHKFYFSRRICRDCLLLI